MTLKGSLKFWVFLVDSRDTQREFTTQRRLKAIHEHAGARSGQRMISEEKNMRKARWLATLTNQPLNHRIMRMIMANLPGYSISKLWLILSFGIDLQGFQLEGPFCYWPHDEALSQECDRWPNWFTYVCAAVFVISVTGLVNINLAHCLSCCSATAEQQDKQWWEGEIVSWVPG